MVKPRTYKRNVECCYNCKYCLLSVWDSYYCTYDKEAATYRISCDDNLDKMYIEPDGKCSKYEKEKDDGEN